MIEIPLKGNIRENSLPRLLAYLNRTRETGTLFLKTPVFTKRIYLVKGDAIFASSTYEDDRLGEMLIKAGKITMEQYDESVKLLKRTGKRQGAILVELGYLTPKDLFWGVKYQVMEIIYSLFQLDDSEYEFVRGAIPEHEVITLKMSMGSLIYEGVKRIDNWTRIRHEMPGTNTVLKLSTDPVTLFQDVDLSDRDKKMLSAIDGKKTVKRLIDESLIGSFEGMKILYVLCSLGIIEEKRDSGKAEAIEEKVPFEEILQSVLQDEHAFLAKVDEFYANLDVLGPSQLLEVDDVSKHEMIMKNYYRLTKEFHPDRYLGSADPSLKDKLTAIFDALTRAYSALKGKEETEKKGEAPATRAKGAAYFEKGVEAFKKKHFSEAADLFRSSTQMEPSNARYWSYLSLCLSKMPRMWKDAEKALLKSVRLEPDNAEHYVNLGLIYLRQGINEKARGQFEKALHLDPKNTRAKKGIEKTKG